MPIVCASSSQDGDIAALTAGALSARLTNSDLLVASTETPNLADVVRSSAASVLIVRDPGPFVAWSRGEARLRVVLGWDDTLTTTAAVEQIVALRRAAAVDVEVVHVYFPDETGRRYGVHVDSLVDPSPEVEAMLRRDIAHQLEGLVGEGDVVITPLHGIGRIADVLMEHAETTGAHLLAVGDHHRSGLRRLSSVASNVVADARVSVLVAPLVGAPSVDLAPQFRVALAATDGSAFANRAVSYAFRIVPDDGEVHLVRVVDAGNRVDHESAVAALRALHPAARRDIRVIPHVVRDADPAHGIATVAERVGADVVCVASHARAGIARALFGSVTDRILHVCRRPVLVIHPSE
jgi:nucleotide-binding universal stress UspA family protein